MEELKRQTSQRLEREATQERAFNLNMANAEDLALGRIGATHRQAQEYNAAREQAIGAYVDEKIGDTKYTSRKALDEARKAARADYEEQERLYDMYSSDILAGQYAEKAQTAYQEAESAYRQAEADYAGAIKYMQDRREAYPGDINALRAAVERTKKAFEEATAKRDQANQFVRYHQSQNEQRAVLKKYGVSADNPDFEEKSAKIEGYQISPIIPAGISAGRRGAGIVEAVSLEDGGNVSGLTPGLTDEQKANIRYLYNTQGKDAAIEYAALLEDANTAARLTGEAQRIADMEEGFARAASKAGYGAAAGLSQWLTGVRNVGGAITGKYYSDPMAEGGQIIRNSIDNVIGRGGYDLVVTAANMAPSIILASGLGSAGVAKDVAGKIGAAAMGTSAGGNAYAQAMAEGKPAFESFMYGTLTGISEAALQSIIGGINPLMSDEGLTKVALDKIGSTIGKKAAQEGAKKITKVLAAVAERASVIGIKSFFEGGEEYLQDILEPVFRNICFNENNEFKPFTEEALYSGIIGAIMGGGDSVIGYAASDALNGGINALNYVSSEATKQGRDALNKAFSGETLTDKEARRIANDLSYRTALSRESGVEIKGNASERLEGVKKAVEAIRENVRSEAEKKASGAYYLEKALRGEKISNSQIDVLFKNEDFARQISEASGVEITGSNSQKRAAVKQAIEILGQRTNVNPEANTATNTAENVEPKTDTTAPAAEEPTIDLARQATEAATQRQSITLDENAQNINVAQEASHSATEGIDENIDEQVADFANPTKNYHIENGEVNTTKASVDSDGKINVELEDGSILKYRLKDITDMLVDRLGFNYVSKSPLTVRRAAGYYIPTVEAISALDTDVATVAHEVGHFLDDKIGMGAQIGIDALKDVYGDTVLKHGYKEEKISRELMAEFTREYLRNRQELQKQHPDLVKAFEKHLKTVDAMYRADQKLPRKERKNIYGGGRLFETIRMASDMFNGYASLPDKSRYGTKITNVTAQEKMIRNDEQTSFREKINKFLYNWDDNALPIKIGSKEAYELALWARVNLANYINGTIMGGVMDDHGEVYAPGWSAIYDAVTKGVKNKTEYQQKKKTFNEYLNMWDIYDSLTIGEKYDEPTRVSKTLEATDRARVNEIRNKIGQAISPLETGQYEYLRKTLSNIIANTSYSSAARNALTALEKALPRPNINKTNPYNVSITSTKGLTNELATQIKGLLPTELAQLRFEIGSIATQVSDPSFKSLCDALVDLLTNVNEDALRQNVFTTEQYLNNPKKLRERIDEIMAQNPTFAEGRKLVRDWYNALQQLMVDAGIWTEAQLQQLQHLHPNYIGLHRAVDMSDYRKSKTKTGRAEMSGLDLDSVDDMLNYTRKGSDKLIYDAFDQATFFANNVLQRVTDNAILRTFYEKAKTDTSLVWSDLEPENIARKATGNDYDLFTYYVDGEQRHFYVNDPLVVASLKWTRPSIGGLYAVKIVTDWTKKFSTQFNPGFAIYSNPIRDVSQSYRNSDRINPSKFVFEWVKSFFEVAGNEIQNPFTQKPLRETKTYKAAKDFGLEGSAPWRGMRSRAARDYRIQLDLEEQNAVRAALSHFGVLTTTLSDILKVGNILETTTRYAQVKRDLAAGKNMKQAVLGGQETTTNFGRQGASALYRKLDAVIPFFSANVQGKFNNIRQFVDYDPRTGKFALKGDAGAKFAKTVATWLVPTLLQYVALLANTDDDEKKKRLEAFRAETNYVKNQYWLMWDGNDTFIKIPKPQTLNPLYSLTERAFDKMALDDPLAFNNFIGYAWNELLASNFTDLTNFTGVGTAIALAKNEDWRGVPIDKKEYYNQPGSAKYHYDATTSFPARWIGSMLNYSPQKIDYIVSDNFPAVGNALKSFASEQGLSDLKQRPGDVVLSVLGLKTRVKADSVYSTDIRNEYYNYKRHVLNIATDAKNYFTPDTSQSEAKKYGENLAQNAIYTSFNNRIYGTISDAIKRINNAEDKRSANKKLNQLLTSLSDVHGEASGGGTQLDKDIATMYSDYDLFQQRLSSKNLDYWQGSATGKTSTGKKETLTASSILSIAPSANALKTAIEATGDSYADIAADIGITEKTLNNYASGTQRIPDDRVKALAARLGVSEEALTPAAEDEWLEAVNRTVAYYSMVEVALNKAWDEFTQTKEYKAAPNREKLRVFEEMRNNACYQALKIISEERYGK